MDNSGFKLDIGLIQVYTGAGKGKTTASLGLGLRAVGQGLKVLMIQFAKGTDTGELLSTKKFGDSFKILQCGSGKFIINREPTPEEREKAEEALNYAEKQINEGRVNLLILDEISHAVNTGLVCSERIKKFLKHKPATVEIVMTGRNMPADIMEEADLVSEIREIKHPFHTGLGPRKGIEY